MISDVHSLYKLRPRNRTDDAHKQNAAKINHSESDGKIKTKVMSMWNNMKYGWTIKLKTNFSKHSPLWILGRCYMLSHEPGLSHGIDSCGDFEDFKADFVSKLWFTYRREFPLLSGSHYTTDCGWGCMLRSGQMLLAQALVCHFLGRDWVWKEQSENSTSDSENNSHALHWKIIKWFADNPSEKSPLSIHSLVKLGELSGKKAGDWYGPGAVAQMLRKAVELAAEELPEFNEILVYVAQDCTVYIQDIIDGTNIINKKDGTSLSKAVVLLVPVRLGIEKINTIYGPCLTKLLSLENCIGIIGGRPKHSLYFVGYQDDSLIYLDPHYCQDVVDVKSSIYPFLSFHCKSPRKISISKLDPSCCIGFYCKNIDDFHQFVKTVKNYLVPSIGAVEYPMFVFSESSSSTAVLCSKLSIPDCQYEYDHNSEDSDESFEMDLGFCNMMRTS